MSATQKGASMNPKTLYNAYLKAMTELGKQPARYKIEFDLLTAWAVGMALQMVCRHPAVTSHSTMRKLIEPVARRILAELGQRDPALQTVVQVGWTSGGQPGGLDVTQMPAPPDPGPEALLAGAMRQMLGGADADNRFLIVVALLTDLGRDQGMTAAQAGEVLAHAYQVAETAETAQPAAVN